MTTMLLAAYAAVAGYVVLYTLYRGVVRARPHRLLIGVDQMLLTLTAIGVGAFWVLFVPGAVAHAARRRQPGRGRRGWSLPPERRAHAHLLSGG